MVNNLHIKPERALGKSLFEHKKSARRPLAHDSSFTHPSDSSHADNTKSLVLGIVSRSNSLVPLACSRVSSQRTISKGRERETNRREP